MTVGSSASADPESWVRRSRRLRVLAAIAAAVIAVLVMAEWWAKSDVLVRISNGTPATFDSMLAVALVAGGLAVDNRGLRRLLLGAGLVWALLLLLPHLGVDLGLDQLFVDDWASPTGTEDPGRTTAVTALVLSGFAAAGLLVELGRTRLGLIVSCGGALVTLLELFRFLFGVSEPLSSTAYPPMPAASILVAALLATASLMAIPGGVPQWIVLGEDTGARLQRDLAAITLGAVPALAYVGLVGIRREWFDLAFGGAAMVSAAFVMLHLIGARLGRHLTRQEVDRETLLAEVRNVNHDLEDRVKLRSHELNRQRTKLALLEERDRIARDLHDRVIQRVFAAGLQLGALSRQAAKLTAGDPDARLPKQLEGVAGELDLAIRELRNSIFQLTSIDDHEDMEQVVHDIVSRSARILGFMPRVELHGDLHGLRADLVANVASTIQEGMSNVARHAHASSASLTFDAGDELLVVITDNGRGMPDPLPRSSGISNLLNRARSLGGTATWVPNPSGGTVFTWRVPRDAEVPEYYGNASSAKDAARPA